MNASVSFEEVTTRVFSKPGPGNTPAVLEAMAKRAEALSISQVLIPTCSGKTALEALKMLSSRLHIIAVTHVTGFREPNDQEIDPKIREDLERRNVSVLTAQHAFGGVGRAVRDKLSTYQVDEIMAYTLRIFGHGTKVAVELALMAADAGLVRTDCDVISAGGSSRGIDTALVLRPSNSFRFFDLKVREVICKPAVF